MTFLKLEQRMVFLLHTGQSPLYCKIPTEEQSMAIHHTSVAINMVRIIKRRVND